MFETYPLFVVPPTDKHILPFNAKNLTIVHHYCDCFSLIRIAFQPRSSLMLDSSTGVPWCSDTMCLAQ